MGRAKHSQSLRGSTESPLRSRRRQESSASASASAPAPGPLEPADRRSCPRPRPPAPLRTRQRGACPDAVRRPGGGASALGIHGDRTRPALAAAMAVPLGAAPASWLLWLSFREPRGCRGARRVQVTLRGWGGVGAGAREPRQE